MVRLSVNAGIVSSEDGSVVQGIERAADLGIEAVEVFSWEDAGPNAIANACEEHGIDLVSIMATGGGFTIDDRNAPAMVNPYDRETVVADIERSIEAAAEAGAHCVLLGTGPNQGGVDRETQRRALERVLKEIAPTAAEHDVTAIVEPLNTVVDHPGYFLSASPEAFDITRSVGSEYVQILFDIYHQQITEGDVIRTLTENLDQLGHVHVADNPGRLEPGTGEIAYGNVFDALDRAGYEGYVGLEFAETSDGTSMTEAVQSTLELADRT